MQSTSSYVLQPVFESHAEFERVHKAFTEYFGNRLALAPLDDIKPQAILDVGCGGGAWAIDAAKQFPEAVVHAFDINPLPPRDIPSNFQFRILDVCEPLPFEGGSFDIVHVRLVMLHIPDVEQVLKRISGLVKPSGWLIVEEPDDGYNPEDAQLHRIASCSVLVSKLHSILRSRGADPCVGRHLRDILTRSGHFIEVNIKKIEIPMCGQSTVSPHVDKLGKVWRESHLDIAASLPAHYSTEGITDEMAQRFREELSDPSKGLTGCMYFAWARRRTE